jgi:hypothetical protein
MHIEGRLPTGNDSRCSLVGTCAMRVSTPDGSGSSLLAGDMPIGRHSGSGMPCHAQILAENGRCSEKSIRRSATSSSSRSAAAVNKYGHSGVGRVAKRPVL